MAVALSRASIARLHAQDSSCNILWGSISLHRRASLSPSVRAWAAPRACYTDKAAPKKPFVFWFRATATEEDIVKYPLYAPHPDAKPLLSHAHPRMRGNAESQIPVLVESSDRFTNETVVTVTSSEDISGEDPSPGASASAPPVKSRGGEDGSVHASGDVAQVGAAVRDIAAIDEAASLMADGVSPTSSPEGEGKDGGIGESAAGDAMVQASEGAAAMKALVAPDKPPLSAVAKKRPSFVRANVHSDNSMPGMRYYVVDGAQYASVTTVLGRTMYRKALDDWKEKVCRENALNEEQFVARMETIKNEGTRVHATVDRYYLSDMDYDTFCATDVDANSDPLWKSLRPAIEAIPRENVAALESVALHRGLGYAGRMDMVALYHGVPCVVDWKSSTNKKTQISQLSRDYVLQLSAYAAAINCDPAYDFSVRAGLIVTCYRDGSPCDIHFIDEKRMQSAFVQFHQRLARFKALLASSAQDEEKFIRRIATGDLSTPM